MIEQYDVKQDEIHFPKDRFWKKDLDLGTAVTDQIFEVEGDYLTRIHYTGNGTCRIKLDSKHAPIIDLSVAKRIVGKYNRIYFTTDGSGAAAEAIICGGFKEELWVVE